MPPLRNSALPAGRPPRGGLPAGTSLLHYCSGQTLQYRSGVDIAGMMTPQSLQTAMQKLPGWKKVRALGFCSRPQVREILGKARMGLVLFHPESNHVNAQPTKLFEYMSAGIPVIASDFPLWRELVGEASAGLLVDPLDPAAIARAIEWILTHEDEAAAMGQRGLQAVRDTYNWEAEEAKLLAMYDELLPAKSSDYDADRFSRSSDPG